MVKGGQILEHVLVAEGLVSRPSILAEANAVLAEEL